MRTPKPIMFEYTVRIMKSEIYKVHKSKGEETVTIPCDFMHTILTFDASVPSVLHGELISEEIRKKFGGERKEECAK